MCIRDRVCPDEDGGRNKIYLTDSLIISYSSKRAEKDAKDRGRLIKKAEKLVGNPSMFKAELKNCLLYTSRCV